MKLLLVLSILLATEWGGASVYMWVSLVVLPTVTGIVSWFAGRRIRNNDTIQKMQDTIDMLVKKNGELYIQAVEQTQKLAQQNEQILNLSQQLAEVRRENAELKAGQVKILEKQAVLQKENAGWKRQLDSIKKDQSNKAKK